MNEFKMGDRVRLVCAYRGKSKGFEDTVIDTKSLYRPSFKGSTQMVYTTQIPGAYSSRFELVQSPSDSFNLAAATDQELADEYRRRVEASYEVALVLRKRGYTICTPGGHELAHATSARLISKVETKTVTL